MRRSKRWSLRLVTLLQFAALMSVLWDDLRDSVFPDGTTSALALVFGVLFIVWEDVIRIRIRLGD